eukprot:jgi/Bigna1/77363/fgenesh1_pg.47_\
MSGQGRLGYAYRRRRPVSPFRNEVCDLVSGKKSHHSEQKVIHMISSCLTSNPISTKRPAEKVYLQLRWPFGRETRRSHKREVVGRRSEEVVVPGIIRCSFCTAGGLWNSSLRNAAKQISSSPGCSASLTLDVENSLLVVCYALALEASEFKENMQTLVGIHNPNIRTAVLLVASALCVIVIFSELQLKGDSDGRASMPRGRGIVLSSEVGRFFDPSEDEGPGATTPEIEEEGFGEPTQMLNKTAWEPFDLSPWISERPQPTDLITEDEFLKSKPRKIDKLEDVPQQHLLASTPLIRSKIDPPRSKENFTMDLWFPHFSKAYVLRIEQGFIGDNGIFGPALRSKDKYFYSMSRWWNGYPRVYEKTAPGIQHKDIGYAVAVGGWGATAFQHFVIDVLPKLALVYDKMMSEEWVQKNVSLITNLGRSPAPRWFLEELGLWKRTLPMMGWPVKAKFIYRSKAVMYPDFHPAPILAGGSRIGQYPRGAMLPVQKALGVFHDSRRDRIVMLCISLAKHVQQQLSRAISYRVDQHNKQTGATIEVERFRFTSREDARDLFRRALMIIGPHGGAFSNMVFAKPGTVVVEFIPMYKFSTKPHAGKRTSTYCYYGLSQACGHRYWFVDPENFDFNRGGMVVRVEDVLHIVDDTLKRLR